MFGSLVATSESWVQIQDAFQICYNLDSEGFTGAAASLSLRWGGKEGTHQTKEYVVRIKTS